MFQTFAGVGHPMSFDELGNGDKMAGMRTALAFQRTRLAADRTMMAIMRTSLSMIGFGFTLYTFTTNFIKRDGAEGLLAQQAPTRFALTMIFLGVLLMTLGIFSHFRFMMAVRGQRDTFIAEGLLPQKEEFPLSLTLVTAILLVLIGVAAGLSVIFRSGPF
ncbi:MAG: YidH family protein [Erythrobacter sp.]|jgi:putative membrane protein